MWGEYMITNLNNLSCPDCGKTPQVTKYWNGYLMIECKTCGNATELMKTVTRTSEAWQAGKLKFRHGKRLW